MVDNRTVETRVEDIKDFVDMFPKELPGLPSDKEIDFVIDLTPGMDTHFHSTISYNTYRVERTKCVITRTL